MCVILLHLMACGVRQGHEWEVEIDDGSNAVVHRTELVLAAMEETEETYEASKIGRRRQTNRDHSVSPAPTCALSFVCEVCVFANAPTCSMLAHIGASLPVSCTPSFAGAHACNKTCKHVRIRACCGARVCMLTGAWVLPVVGV